MSVPIIIVDGKTSLGKRVSISIDLALWTLYVASRSNDAKEARLQLKKRMSEGKINNTYDAKRWIYTEIARPTLLTHSDECLESA